MTGFIRESGVQCPIIAGLPYCLLPSWLTTVDHKNAHHCVSNNRNFFDLAARHGLEVRRVDTVGKRQLYEVYAVRCESPGR